MAMMATEAEETARQQARAASAPAALASATLGTSPPGRHSSQTNQGSGPSGSTQQSKGQGAKGQSVRQQLHALVQASGAGWRGRQGAGGGAAGASGAGGSGKANIVVAAPGFSNCWAEVWCGSAESGRWVHVDVGAGTVDRWVGGWGPGGAEGGRSLCAVYPCALHLLWQGGARPQMGGRQRVSQDTRGAGNAELQI